MKTTLVAMLWLELIVGASLVVEHQRVQRADKADQALSPLFISTDGKEVTLRPAAKDALRICVEPATNTFGRRVCFTVGDVRAGLVGLR
jgi:hypothetical protein